ncbi:TOMM precursor leader peptide-binding protein [Nonomuraea sediminis]|uniref:TOMM precursor leader peptide-binding protein n=1 Tax=Nonomuraea sediminis TaxID=2835864 RepID=UPI001BDC4BEE|nr:TOMM precursor leader peptide-binding protein [Nonomuraea sediminis]
MNLILALDPFGHAVAARLRAADPTALVHHVDDGTHPSLWPHADVIVLAAGRERLGLAEAVDRAAHAWRVPWFGVHPSAGELRCGPVVIPGRTACHACYLRRREQHRTTEPDQVERRMPTGHPAHHVGVAAALARQALAEAVDGPEPGAIGATVRLFGQVDGATRTATVVAVDRCPRCRTRPVRDDELWPAFARISQESAS